MKLKRLSIYRGTAEFVAPLGKVELQLGDNLSRRLLEECADELVASSRAVAAELTTSMIEQVAAIEAPVES